MNRRLWPFSWLALAVALWSAIQLTGCVSDAPTAYGSVINESGRDSVVDWIRQHSMRLTTVKAGNGFDDMQPLKNVIGTARIVSLGEATHGTREFFQLKHRLIEFLTNQMHFTIFSIEANMPEAYRLNDFVLDGVGDPKQLLKGMYFWTWDTEEVLNMILWMREFNQSGKGHIEFTGFDMQTPTVALRNAQKFVKLHDPAYSDFVDHAYNDIPLEFGRRSVDDFGVATARFPVDKAAGRHIRYSGFIRTEDVTKGFAGLWWRVDGEPGQTLAFDNMQDRAATGSSPWTRYEISMDVPMGAKAIYFGVVHPGTGVAWFDSLRVEIDSVEFVDGNAFDLDFESDLPRGFYTGGNGYAVFIDKSVFHTGKQSLCIKSVSPQPIENDATRIKNITEECGQIVKHLEEKRPILLRTSTARQVDWAIQNARLVLQFAQVRAGERTRDESMAENVKWIADHNPDARIVLWAHNGHVTYSENGVGTTLGAYLRKAFNNDLVTFGFTFNEGSFRALESGKGSLREFTVAPLPDDSLDRTLASANIPILALDLRQIPRQGMVADWFNRPHATRSVGAFYSPTTTMGATVDIKAQDAFDAILFVEKTTASRGNP